MQSNEQTQRTENTTIRTSSIVKVVVFSDQALVTRRIKAGAGSGINRFLVDVKAFDVDSDSIQTRVFGRGELLSVQYRIFPMEQPPQEDLRSLEEKKRAAYQKMQVIKDRLAIIGQKKKFMDGLVDFAAVEIPTEIKTAFPRVEHLRETLDFLDKSYSSGHEEEQALEIEREELSRVIRVLEQKIKWGKVPGKLERKVIEVLFDSSAEQDLEMDIAYICANVRWRPVYKVDVSTERDTVSLSMFAEVNQRSGEHWKDVAVSVSNAVPLQGAALPELYPWRLALPQPPQPAYPMAAAQAGGPPEGVEQRMDALIGSALSEDEELGCEDFGSMVEEASAECSQAEAKELPLAFEYELKQRVDMESDDRETILPLFTKETPGEFFHYCVPAEDPLAYLVCRATGDSALLPGRMNIYFDGRFIGSAALGEKKAGEELLLNLGADRGVKARREKISDKVTETFFNMADRSSIARKLEFRLYIENLLGKNIRVHVIDHIPVAETDKIQVKGLELHPKPTEENWQERQGVMLWDMDVEAGSLCEISMLFHVKHPRGSKPVGL